MKKVAIIGCGAYMDSGPGCPGEWRCLKAAALGDGNFNEQPQVIEFIRCECPGRTVVPNTGMAVKLSEIKPDEIYLNSCLTNAVPGCPYISSDDLAKALENKLGVKVVSGTHDYH